MMFYVWYTGAILWISLSLLVHFLTISNGLAPILLAFFNDILTYLLAVTLMLSIILKFRRFRKKIKTW